MKFKPCSRVNSESIKGSFIIVFIAMTFSTLNCRARFNRAAVEVMLRVGKQAESGNATCLGRASQTSRGEIKLIFSVNTCGAAPLKPPQVYKYYRFFFLHYSTLFTTPRVDIIWAALWLCVDGMGKSSDHQKGKCYVYEFFFSSVQAVATFGSLRKPPEKANLQRLFLDNQKRFIGAVKWACTIARNKV